jgi:hypothetical protein
MLVPSKIEYFTWSKKHFTYVMRIFISCIRSILKVGSHGRRAESIKKARKEREEGSRKAGKVTSRGSGEKIKGRRKEEEEGSREETQGTRRRRVGK